MVAVKQDGGVQKSSFGGLIRYGLTAAIIVAIVIAIWTMRRDGDEVPQRSIAQSVAVLPFVDLSSSQDQAYLGLGLAEDIIATLSQQPELHVIARTSSFYFHESGSHIAAIRDALNVTFVVEGSVRRTGDRLRVTAQLIDASNSVQVWSKQFDATINELGEIRQTITTNLLARIAPDIRQPAITDARDDVSASELMLLARYYEQQVRDHADVPVEILQKSIDLYRDAAAAAPDSALAHGRLGRILLYANEIGAARLAIDRALSLNPDLSEVQETYARYLWLIGDSGAGEAWRRAVELNPNNADAISSYGYWYWIYESADGPADYFRQAKELDPMTLSRYADLGSFLGHEARTAEVEAVIADVTSRFDSAESYRVVARLYDLIGRTDHSIAWILKARIREPDNASHRGALAELLIDIGEVDTALAVEPDPGVGLLLKLRRYTAVVDLAELLVIDYPEDVQLRYLLGYAYTVIDEPENAIRILRSVGFSDDREFVVRQPMDIEAIVTYADALSANGEVEQARSEAQSWMRQRHTNTTNWWLPMYTACILSIDGRADEALQQLEQLANSARLPWAYLLYDSHCFRTLAESPRFEAVAAAFEARRADIRRQLTTTLKNHNVSLPGY